MPQALWSAQPTDTHTRSFGTRPLPAAHLVGHVWSGGRGPAQTDRKRGRPSDKGLRDPKDHVHTSLAPRNSSIVCLHRSSCWTHQHAQKRCIITCCRGRLHPTGTAPGLRRCRAGLQILLPRRNICCSLSGSTGEAHGLVEHGCVCGAFYSLHANAIGLPHPAAAYGISSRP